MSPRDLLQAQAPGEKPLSKLRVHNFAGKSVVVYHPALRGDSLVGEVQASVATSALENWSGPRAARKVSVIEPAAIPLDSIRAVDVRGRSASKTLAVWGIGLGIYAAIIAATWEGSTYGW